MWLSICWSLLYNILFFLIPNLVQRFDGQCCKSERGHSFPHNVARKQVVNTCIPLGSPIEMKLIMDSGAIATLNI